MNDDAHIYTRAAPDAAEIYQKKKKSRVDWKVVFEYLGFVCVVIGFLLVGFFMSLFSN